MCGNNDDYPYGFNGQMKDNEWAGVGNHNTALYWEYDTRTARRANLDPVVKLWRSPYDVFDNSPIWKNDLYGDDDFFNTKGEFLRSDNKGSAIKIVDGKNIISFNLFLKSNAYTFKDHLAVTLGIVNHYAPRAGVKGRIGFNRQIHSPNSPANTNEYGVVNINVAFRASGYDGYLNNGNIINTLKHEALHQQYGDVVNFADHAKVYLLQITDISFTKGTTDEYQWGMVRSFVSYLMNSYVQDPNTNDAIELIIKFNKENKAGFTLQTNTATRPEDLEITIYDKTGASAIEKFEKKDDPH